MAADIGQVLFLHVYASISINKRIKNGTNIQPAYPRSTLHSNGVELRFILLTVLIYSSKIQIKNQQTRLFQFLKRTCLR